MQQSQRQVSTGNQRNVLVLAYLTKRPDNGLEEGVIMSEFPGYKSPAQIAKLRAAEQQEATWRAHKYEAAKVQRAYEYVRNAVPLLIEHATDASYPTEVTTGRFFKKTHLERGWHVRTLHHPSTEASFSNFGEASDSHWALTETGFLGSAHFVDRGIRAMSLSDGASLISPDQFTIEQHAHDVMAGIRTILEHSGVEYR